jgi:hypothetical protein
MICQQGKGKEKARIWDIFCMGQLIAVPGWESQIVPGMGLVLKSHSVVL